MSESWKSRLAVSLMFGFSMIVVWDLADGRGGEVLVVLALTAGFFVLDMAFAPLRRRRMEGH